MSNYLRIYPTLFFALLMCTMIIIADIKGTSYLLRHFPKVPMIDKWGHLLMFGMMAFLLNFSLAYRKVTRWLIPVGSLIVLTFAVCEEFSQLALSGRSFEWADMFFDVIGVSIFSVLSYLLFRLLPVDFASETA